MKKDTPKNTKELKKQMKKDGKKALANDTFKFKVVLCDNKCPTLYLIITAIGRCWALFTKAFIVGLAIKTVLF